MMMKDSACSKGAKRRTEVVVVAGLVVAVVGFNELNYPKLDEFTSPYPPKFQTSTNCCFCCVRRRTYGMVKKRKF